MATRGTIAVEHQDGTITQVYSHWDNYLEHNGRLLLDYYNSQTLAEELVSMGEISSLGPRIHPKGPHTSDHPEEHVSVFYHRDHGQLFRYMIYSNYSHYQQDGRYEEYNYIFRDNQWFVDWPNPETLLVDAFDYQYDDETDEYVLVKP